MGCAIYCLNMLRTTRKTRKKFPQKGDGEGDGTSNMSNKKPASLVILISKV